MNSNKNLVLIGMMGSGKSIIGSLLAVTLNLEFYDVDNIIEIDYLTAETTAVHSSIHIFPARHFIAESEKLQKAIVDIENELEERITYFKKQEILLEAQRIEQRTRYDIEMLREVGYCSGIENYSRH